MRILLSLLIFVFTLVFSTHADVSTPLDIECCISINEKLDEQTDILKQQYELSAKNELIINDLKKIVSKPDDTNITLKDWLNLLGVFLGTVISAIVAILVFVFGLKKEKEKEKERKCSLLKSTSIILKDIINTCNQRIISITKYTNNITEKPWSHNKLGIIPIDEILRLKNMDISQTADAFFEFHINEKNYIDLYSKLDFIYDLFKNIENDYFKHSHDYVTIPSNEIIEITRWSSEFIFNELRLGKFEKIIFQITTIYNNFDAGIKSNNENMNNIDYINNNFTIPYLELFSNSTVSEQAFELLSKLKRAKDLYTFICDANTYFSQELSNQKENINKCIKIFNNIINEINSKINYTPEQNNSSQDTNPSEISTDEG